jgi:predicted transcriptional regulator
MTSITITLPDDRLAKLREIAARLHVTPEDLARVGIEELLTRPDETYKQVAEYVLKKNSELYRRLA